MIVRYFYELREKSATFLRLASSTEPVNVLCRRLSREEKWNWRNGQEREEKEIATEISPGFP